MPPFNADLAEAGQCWHTRGYLPHYDHGGSYQMVTYRLADSLPNEALNRLLKIQMMRRQLKEYTQAGRLRSRGNEEYTQAGRPRSRGNEESIDAAFRQAIEKWLNQGHGSCVLRRPEMASMVVENWRHFDKQRYGLIAYVVMPNHVHVLVKTYPEWALSTIVHTWKSYTGKQMLVLLQAAGERPVPGNTPLGWQIEYWDRCIRNEQHFHDAVDYIHKNPVKAGLCADIKDWWWSSAKEKT